MMYVSRDSEGLYLWIGDKPELKRVAADDVWCPNGRSSFIKLEDGALPLADVAMGECRVLWTGERA